MKKLALALAAVAVVGFSAPSFARDAGPDARIHLAQADVKVKVRHGHRGTTVKKVIVRRDHGMHRGWRHDHRRGHKVVVIKKHRRY